MKNEPEISKSGSRETSKKGISPSRSETVESWPREVAVSVKKSR